MQNGKQKGGGPIIEMVRSVSFFFGFFGFVVSFFFVFFCFFQVKLVEPDRTVPEGNHKDRNEYFSFSFAWISSVIIVIIHCIAKKTLSSWKTIEKEEAIQRPLETALEFKGRLWSTSGR